MCCTDISAKKKLSGNKIILFSFDQFSMSHLDYSPHLFMKEMAVVETLNQSSV